jgi:hypothetical protein
MLLPVVFIMALMLALTGALLENSLQAAKSASTSSVAQFSDVAIADGVADVTSGLAQVVRIHGASTSWSGEASTSALKSGCNAGATQSCPFRYTIRATVTSASSASTPAQGSDPANNLQAAAIDEQRVSALVTVAIVGENGALLGTRTRFLTYRIFDTAPYAVISGSRDLATVNGTRSAAQGDSGGASGATAPGGGSPAAGIDDTRIHVRLTCRTVIAGVVPFTNDQQVAGNDGLPWGNAANAAYEAPCAGPDAPADDFRDERWGNGNTNRSGWTQ